MKLRLYLDEDTIRAGLVQALRSYKVDVATVYESEKLGDSDEQQLRYASTQERAIYTFNRKDFMALHTNWLEAGRAHAGIIIGQQQRFGIGEQARRLVKLVDTVSAEEMRDRVEFLSAWG